MKIRSRALLPPTSRKITYISVEEIDLGIRKVISDSIAIQPKELVSLVSKLFSFSRVTDDVKKGILAVEYSLKQEHIYKDGQFLKSNTSTS
ncbi:hypothetical protein [Chryseobacterium sp. S90]|uniref:hypothetical protein n=1 Tax=Chryseobacterium sp. S90 TaxID=3395373 RepID=UPI0039BCEF05